MLDGARRRAADRRGDARGAMRGDDDTRRARAFGAPADGAQVARIGNPVEADEQRLLLGGQLVPVGVAVRRALGDDALVIAGAGRLAQLALELHLHARPAVLQPRLGRERTLARPQLEHLTRAAERLSNSSPPVDLLRGHLRGTSW
jgi:hypothetical protein